MWELTEADVYLIYNTHPRHLPVISGLGMHFTFLDRHSRQARVRACDFRIAVSVGGVTSGEDGVAMIRVNGRWSATLFQKDMGIEVWLRARFRSAVSKYSRRHLGFVDSYRLSAKFECRISMLA